MRRSKFTESQILTILGEGEAGLPVEEVCRKHGISSATYDQWKSKFAGMSVSELKRVKANALGFLQWAYHPVLLPTYPKPCR